MKEYKSKTHQVTVSDDGLIKAWPLAPRELRITNFDNKGGVDVTILNSEVATDPSEKKILCAMDRMPLFVAGYAGNSEWQVDLDCGFQRWQGVKSTRDLSKALSNCGLEPSVKKEIMTTCRKFHWEYVPRQG